VWCLTALNYIRRAPGIRETRRFFLASCDRVITAMKGRTCAHALCTVGVDDQVFQLN